MYNAGCGQLVDTEMFLKVDLDLICRYSLLKVSGIFSAVYEVQKLYRIKASEMLSAVYIVQW